MKRPFDSNADSIRDHQMLKANITKKRLEEIESIQGQLRKLAEEYSNDFSEPNALDAIVARDFHAATTALELLKGLYKSRDKKAG